MTEPAQHGTDPFRGPVLVVGAGLIGGSVGMALTRAGVITHIGDIDTSVAHVASSRGAGSDQPLERAPGLVVIATPPDLLASEIAKALDAYPEATVTDVGSVKGKPLDELRATGVDVTRYVGSHPMAGSERSGPMASASDLFVGRTWAVVPRSENPPYAVSAVERLAELCGATVVHMTTEEHDLAVARVSQADHLALSGQGVRDVTRVAGGDPRLWRQIVTANAAALSRLLTDVRDDIDSLLVSLDSQDGGQVEKMLEAGVAGTAAIPGKHGGPALKLAAVTVAIPDQPGALANLFADARDAGVNVEDLRMDHDPARAYGLVEIDVADDQADRLIEALRARNWSAHR
jgi:prephenate dehydrogenase